MASGDLTDAEWELVGPLLAAGRGRPGREDRRLLDGIFWRAREGARWRAIPERYGRWNTVRRRFARWRDLGVFEAIFRRLGRERRGRRAGPDARRHHDPRPPARGRREKGRDDQALGRSQGGFSTKLHLRCDARGLPLAIVLTPGQTHEMRAFDMLVEGLAPGTRCLIGDMGYDADRIRQGLLLRGVPPVIPANPVRKEPVPLDRELYRLRNRVERLVNRLKQFRAVATRYDETAESASGCRAAFSRITPGRLF